MTGTTLPTSRRTRPVLRGDIEGMRAVAVLMVLLYHAQVPFISGGFAGVDVFFVISGFLITSLLIREVKRRGTISITDFYARRARRLLPAATLVLCFTGVVGYLVLPAGVRGDLGWDVVASTLYVVNWALAFRAVDYLAEDTAPSALQHYWSLSVEEQFYVFWPLLMIAAVVLARRMGGRRFRMMGLFLGAITVASLGWSVIHTASSPGTAYFVTTTRVWELGFGALLAFGVPRLRGLRYRYAEALAAAGILMVLLSVLLISRETPWPGSAALLPVLGTTAVLAAGCASDRTVTGRVLGTRPMRFVGGISYSLYLWHWPLLVFLEELRPEAGLVGRLLVVLLAVLLAWVTKLAVEDPIRFQRSLAARPVKALALGGAGMAVSSLVGAALVLTTPTLSTSLPQWAVGAQALMADPGSSDPEIASDVSDALPTSGQVFPDPELATEDVPVGMYDERGCQTDQGVAQVTACDFGDTESDTVWAVVGDSKMAQWMSGLDRLGRQEGILVRTYTKSACAWTEAVTILNDEPYTDCQAWGQEVLERLTGPERPEVVITSAGRASAIDADGEDTAEGLVAGYSAYWQALLDSGIGVVALADNPHPGTEVYTCVAENPDDFSVCDFGSREGGGTPALRAGAEAVPGAEFVDLTDWLCLDETCPAVIGQVLVYRQGSHVTASYAETMTSVLRAELMPAVRQTVQAAAAR